MKCTLPSAIAGSLLAFVFGSVALAADAPAPQGYYRYPAIHGDTIAFVAEGDVWTVGIKGGVARRLTSHPGEETHPRISPDGQLLAFAASYEGPTEVYTMPLEGGSPTRRTFSADTSVPVGWTPGGHLLYNTQHYSTLPNLQLVEIDLANGRHTRIPLSQSGEASIDPNGTIYFVRPPFHRQAVKRYHGGTARKIWRFAPKDTEATNLTADYVGESFAPMWEHGRVYFVTDRDGTLNIWSMKPCGPAAGAAAAASAHAIPSNHIYFVSIHGFFAVIDHIRNVCGERPVSSGCDSSLSLTHQPTIEVEIVLR